MRISSFQFWGSNGLFVIGNGGMGSIFNLGILILGIYYIVKNWGFIPEILTDYTWYKKIPALYIPGNGESV